MGTSHQAVGNAKRKPAQLDRAYEPNRKPFANPEKREPWRSRNLPTRALTISPSKRTAKQRAYNPANSQCLRFSSNPLESRQIGLVMVAFRRALRRYRAKLSRLEFVGGSHELSTCASSESWIAQADAWLELERFIRRLSARNADVLMFRAAGFEWKEIASCFSESVATVRNRFSREIDRLW